MNEKSEKLIGRVLAGLGEGRYYISRKGYSDQFSEMLGFKPFPGTLNLKLNEPFRPAKYPPIEIKEFQDEGRTFGGCSCYKICMKEVDAAIIRPDWSCYPADLVEVIAPISLKNCLGLSDGDFVSLMIQLKDI